MLSEIEKSQVDYDVIDDEFVQLEAIQYLNHILGDCLAIIGGLLFGLCDVIIEWNVKNVGGPDEYLGCVGIFGFVISVVQASVIERVAISNFFSQREYK